ncbi:metal-dependent hydrolase [Candidatus Methanomethylophilus sp. 1R26]|jgi:5-methylthioadenosine/S-adenosylhomocysteine deaminase|uniref:amidohydrolase family protein n=1 Tax=Candidatus Methanomethylophilus sp. 1R26 TaxID=1769296 RepID=UPI0007370E4A|nr:amidohydrolase family protein [Candidatus Methanomethylophilus sp. 1R26]KUE73991.1 metal-dependent hydrolase [Candidatus Methanomethylophilus sp. 1R26]MCH3978682.1 amidohydrolase family protein [Methanomethylophilus sp.]MCI2075226.1 amidohydrolase family protein [Methanomethylophilus sp.]MCI2092568.1 amidohydrolase family protein [Methanomethylophilus sp.]
MLTVFRDAWIVTQNAAREVVRGDVAVEGERIVQVGGKYNGTGDEEIDCSGDIIIPGLVNTHTHIAMSVMKGVVDDLSFDDFLAKVFKIDADRTDADLALGTKIGAAEMMLSGTTTFMDLYYSEDVIAKATQEAGIRGVLCWCCLDEDKTTQNGNPVKNCDRFIQRFSGERKIVPGVGLQGVYVCGEETCVQAKELSDSTGAPMNFHLSETRGEVNAHKRQTGKRPAEWLSSIGVLGPRGVAAHSAWLTMNEVRLMGEAGMSVSSCPCSNMKLATGGVAPVPEFDRYGVNVSLGTDGSTTNNSLDMIGEMKTLGLLQKASRWDPTVTPAQELLDIVTVNGAKAVGMSDRIGSIESGKYADLVVLDGKAPNLRPLVPENIIANLAYSLNQANVKTVMCQGDIVVRDRKVTTMDVPALVGESEEAWRKLCLR